MEAHFGESIGQDVLIVPVPTARRRVRSRGYDQAVVIARALAKRKGCRYAPLLLRYGSQEQKQADRFQRRQQLRGAYAVREPASAVGARILLIDDVVTTGATLEEAATLLKAAGARVVGGLVFARA
jgi:ComF family protein